MRYLGLIWFILVFVFVLVGCEDGGTAVDPASQDETETAGETADAIDTESTDTTLNESGMEEVSFSCNFACFVGTECRSRCEEITVEGYLEWEEVDNERVQSVGAEVYEEADTQCAALYETICESAPLDLGWISNGGPPGYEFMEIEFEIETHLGTEYCSDLWKEPCVCDHEATALKYNDCHDVNEDTSVAWREICLESNEKSIEICGESQVCSPFEGPNATQTCVDP